MNLQGFRAAAQPDWRTKFERMLLYFYSASGTRAAEKKQSSCTQFGYSFSGTGLARNDFSVQPGCDFFTISSRELQNESYAAQPGIYYSADNMRSVKHAPATAAQSSNFSTGNIHYAISKAASEKAQAM